MSTLEDRAREIEAWAIRLAHYWPDSLTLWGERERNTRLEERIAFYRSELGQFSIHVAREERERCTKVMRKEISDYLGLSTSQREYGWHDVEDALDKAAAAIRSLGDVP